MDKFEIKIAEGISIPKQIESNIAELDTFIKEKEQLAESLVVTNDMSQVEAADKDAAEITKMGKELARFRIDFIEKWKAPVETFETTCKSYEKRLETAAHNLRTKTAEVKQIALNKKREDLRAKWSALVAEKIPADLQGSKHFDAFFAFWTSPTAVGNWLNKSMKPEKVAQAMSEEIDRVSVVICTIEELYKTASEETKAKAKLVMAEDFDVTHIMSAVQAWQDEQAKIKKAREEAEARKAALEEERKRREEIAASTQPTAAPAAPVAPAAPTPTNPANSAKPASNATTSPAVYKLTLRFTATSEKLRALRAYIDENGISYEKIGEATKC